MACDRPSPRLVCEFCKQRGAIARSTPRGMPCWAVGEYVGGLARDIRRLKFNEESICAERIGAALGQLLPEPIKQGILMPVPLHPLRLSERGYNQAALIARALQRTTSMQTRFDVLARTIATNQQARLGRAERQTNTAGAFHAKRRPLPTEENLPVFLIDDVVTTGATIDACAVALQTAGWKVSGTFCCATSFGHSSELERSSR